MKNFEKKSESQLRSRENIELQNWVKIEAHQILLRNELHVQATLYGNLVENG